MVVRSACVSTRKVIGTSIPYRSRTWSVSTGVGQAIPCTVRCCSSNLIFIEKRGEDFVRRVVPSGREVADRLLPFLGGKEGEQLDVGLTILLPGRHDDGPILGGKIGNGLAAKVVL